MSVFSEWSLHEFFNFQEIKISFDIFHFLAWTRFQIKIFISLPVGLFSLQVYFNVCSCNYYLMLTFQSINAINNQGNSPLPQTVGPVNGQHHSSEVVVVGSKISGEGCRHCTTTRYRHIAALMRIINLLASLSLSFQDLKIRNHIVHGWILNVQNTMSEFNTMSKFGKEHILFWVEQPFPASFSSSWFSPPVGFCQWWLPQILWPGLSVLLHVTVDKSQ